ncbi:MAG: DciA family protein [Reyranella sp.]
MRENGFRAIGGLAQRLTSGIAKGKGASTARLRAEWSAIVGPDLARTTRPDSLLAGRGARGVQPGAHAQAGKVLRLRVSGAAALEVQHQTGQIVERVNAYFGHRLIDDIRLVQGTIAAAPPPRPIPTPDPKTVTQVAARAATVKDPDLRAALTRLGARVALNRRGVMAAALGALFVADDLRAQELPRARMLEPLPGDHMLGKADAPNSLIAYFSFTCPHCATFYMGTLPTLKREWIDTGRMRFIHRHFPSDIVATRAAQLSECVPADRFFAFTEALFRSHVEWLTGSDPEADMVKVLAGQGVTAQSAQTCYANDRALDKVVFDVQTGQALGVRSTPTLFINEENYLNPGGPDAIAAILRQVGR